MGTQVSYPGIYIQEFTPGAPIQGVGTSTGCFIGTALMGPNNVATQITSWDEFQSIFGGFIPPPTNSYLAPAVYGFFLNGGTVCYIVRASIGANATSDLLTRQASPQTDLVATAVQEGTVGNTISVQVTDSSRLATQLAAAGSPQTTLALAQASTGIVNFDTTATIMTVTSNTGFVAGDRVNLSNGGPAVTAMVASTQGATTIVLAGPVAGAAGLIGGTVRTDDLRPGQTSFRVVVPTGLVLSLAVPPGALISVTEGATTENVSVASSSGTTITLSTPLVNTYPMAGPSFPQIASLEFNLNITNSATGQVENWTLLSMNPLHPGYWGTVVQSKIIALSPPPSPPTGTLPDPRPKDAIYNLSGGANDDQNVARSQIVSDPGKFIDPLKPIQDIDIMAMPGITEPGPQQYLVTHCQTMFNRFAILDGVADNTPGFTLVTAQLGEVISPNGFAALYFPAIQAVNPLSGATEYWPPSGHIMGIYAQTDQSRGVYKAPANVPIAGALGLQTLMTDTDQGILNLQGINVLRVFPEQAQPLVWGARTTATIVDSDWQYINVRRLFIYLEQSIQQGIRWAIFEPNNLMLWGSLKRTITEFLNRVQASGGIQSFYVRIDSALNPPAVQALGQLYIEVGIQPTYPAEFIILRIGIWQGGSSVTES